MALVKTKKEIQYIQTACKLGDAIFKEALSFIKKNKNATEKMVANFILSRIKARKLRPSFPPIVTSGARAGNDIHPKPADALLKGFAIIDLGVRFQGYCSDMTRTIYKGTPTQKERDLYQLMLDAERLGVKKSRLGVACADIDREVRLFLGTYKKYFIHTLGHGVGRKIHEPPIIYEKRPKPILKEGMVVTIEPGIYVRDTLGIRIEDTIVITHGVPKILTKTSKKLVCIS